MTQTYLLPCSCGQKVQVANAQAGGQVACVCGNRLSVPTLRGLRQLEPAPAPARVSTPRWSRWHGALFASGLILAGAGLCIFAFYLLRYAQLGGAGLAVDRSAEFLSGMSAQIDKLTPAEALEMWTGEIKTEGLGQAQKPYWIAAKDKLAEYVHWMQLGGTAFAVGTLLAVGALFIGRQNENKGERSP